MIRKYLVKSAAVFAACILAINAVACGAGKTVSSSATESSTMITQDTVNEDQLTDAISAAVGSSEDASDKVETVYVMSDANGAVNNIIVSDWLKNSDKSAGINDKTNLTDIVNVKGKESYTDNGDGTITWNANGSDIYYQGSTTQELPVDVKVSYKLDGADISPAELAGKSGKVTIRFDYTNNAKQTVQIGGKDADIYTPFAMISGVMLDNSKFSNVEVTNGKVISDAGNYVVMGMALPGLKDSLALDDDKLKDLELTDEDIEIPDYVEITADTTDFTLGMTLTMASSDALNDLGLTKLTDSDKINDIKDDMNELTDGSTKLVDGGHKLQDGVSDLKDGTGKLSDGTQKLYDGTGDLANGINDYTNGASLINDGAAKLQDGANQLNDGAAKLNDGAGTLNDGAAKLKDGSAQVTNGAAQLKNGAGQLKDGANQLKDGAATAKDGSTQLRKGYEDNKVVDNSKALATGAGQVSDGVNQLAGKVNGLATTVQTTGTELSANQRYAQEAYLWLLNGTAVPAEDTAAVDAMMQQLTAQIAQKCGGSTGSMAEWTAIKQQMAADQAQVQSDSAKLLEIKQKSDALAPQIEAAIAYFTAMQSENGQIDNTRNDSEDVVVESEDNYAEPSIEDGESGEIVNDMSDDGADDASAESSEAPVVTPEEPVVAEPEAVAPETVTEAQPEATPAASVAAEADDDEDEDEDVVLPSNAAQAATIVDGQTAVATTEASVVATPAAPVVAAPTAPVAAPTAPTQVVEVEEDYDPNAFADLTPEEQALANQFGQLGVSTANIPSALAIVAQVQTKTQEAVTAAAKQQASEKMQEVGVNIQTLATALTLSNNANGLYADLMGTTEAPGCALRYATEYGAVSAAAAACAASAGTLDQVNTKFSQATEGMDLSQLQTLVDGAKQVADGSTALSAGVAQLYAGTVKLDDGLGTLNTGAATLAGGASNLSNGANSLYDGAKQVSDGAGTLADGTSTLKDGTSQLAGGAGELASGAGTLYNGTSTLVSNNGKLVDGANELRNGANDLNNGAKELDDGVVKLVDGVDELVDGLVKFDEEGIQKLSKAFDGDLSDFADRIDAIRTAGSDYTTFAGSNDGTQSSVKFIIKTEGVKVEEQ